MRDIWANRFVLLKKLATRFGHCIRLINDHKQSHTLPLCSVVITDVTADVFDVKL